jgi:hypothetical protein
MNLSSEDFNELKRLLEKRQRLDDVTIRYPASNRILISFEHSYGNYTNLVFDTSAHPVINVSSKEDVEWAKWAREANGAKNEIVGDDVKMGNIDYQELCTCGHVRFNHYETGGTHRCAICNNCVEFTPRLVFMESYTELDKMPENAIPKDDNIVETSQFFSNVDMIDDKNKKIAELETIIRNLKEHPMIIYRELDDGHEHGKDQYG